MKKNYTALIPLILLLLTACKKDKPDTFQSRLTGGTWELYEVDAYNYINPTFVNGYFNFDQGGKFEYQDMNGNSYKGIWEIYYYEDSQTHGMYLTVFNLNNYATQHEYFDEIQFTSSDHFIALFHSNNLTFKFYFKRS